MCVGFQNWNPYKMPNSVEGSQEMVKEKINNDLKRTDSVSTSICYPKLSEWKSLSRVQLFATHGLYMVAYPFSSRSSRPRNQTEVSYIMGEFFTSWVTREALPQTKWNWNPKVGLRKPRI